MLGAIIGDIAGSVYERPENNIKTKDFPFFDRLARITDDTVLTCAVANAFMEYLAHPKITDLRNTLIDSLKSYGNAHQFVPYGKQFRKWMEDYRDKDPYNSFGNGSAMRVSPVAWFFESLEEVETMAKTSAEITHNHPKGIAGAQAVAAAVFMARTGKSKEEIHNYICKHYYPLDFTLDEIRPNYYGDLSCDGSVPQAIVSFLEADSFEDAVRNAVSIGGDSDTIAAMAGSIAEAFYGIPDEIRTSGLRILAQTDDLFQTYRRFEKFIAVRKALI